MFVYLSKFLVINSVFTPCLCLKTPQGSNHNYLVKTFINSCRLTRVRELQGKGMTVFKPAPARPEPYFGDYFQMTESHKFGTLSPITNHAWNKDRTRKQNTAIQEEQIDEKVLYTVLPFLF